MDKEEITFGKPRLGSTKRLRSSHDVSNIKRDESDGTVDTFGTSFSNSPTQDRIKIDNLSDESRKKKITAKRLLQEQLEMEASLGSLLQNIQESRKSGDKPTERSNLKASSESERFLSSSNGLTEAESTPSVSSIRTNTKASDSFPQTGSINSNSASSQQNSASRSTTAMYNKLDQENKRPESDDHAVFRSSLLHVQQDRDDENPKQINVLNHIKVERSCCRGDSSKRKRLLLLTFTIALVFMVTVAAVITASVLILGNNKNNADNPMNPPSIEDSPPQDPTADTPTYGIVDTHKEDEEGFNDDSPVEGAADQGDGGGTMHGEGIEEETAPNQGVAEETAPNQGITSGSEPIEVITGGLVLGGTTQDEGDQQTLVGGSGAGPGFAKPDAGATSTGESGPMYGAIIDTTESEYSHQHSKEVVKEPDRLPKLKEILRNYVQIPRQLDNVESLEYQAMDWLAFGDPMVLPIKNSTARLIQRFSARWLYLSTQPGTQLINEGKSECDWSVLPTATEKDNVSLQPPALRRAQQMDAVAVLTENHQSSIEKSPRQRRLQQPFSLRCEQLNNSYRKITQISLMRKFNNASVQDFLLYFLLTNN